MACRKITFSYGVAQFDLGFQLQIFLQCFHFFFIVNPHVALTATRFNR